MKKYIIPLAITLVSFGLAVIARFSKSFSDFYTNKIFHYISEPFAFITGLVPFSVGEILIIIGILCVVIGIPLMIILLIAKKNSRGKIASFSVCFALWVLSFVSVTESLNCFIMYGCTTFSERYFESKEHPKEELVSLYALLIDKTNELSVQVPRDEDNRFELTINPQKESIKAMKKAAEKYPQLSGYYPDAKPISFSYFMSQSNLLGMYFPFSMEANYNDDMVRTNLPEVLCHEYAHLKGFIQEDEANFISFIATCGSDDPQVQYSGYLEALEYVHNQIYKNKISSGYELTDKISENVRNDWFKFLPENYWEENEKKEIIKTETVNSVSTAASDASLKINGVEDGIESYSRMVNLLLDYYYPPENQ
ncbi:MAG: DUF3810 domain-containing protein [Ruminococcus sp.]|nr:DUF3810 domain-containing protein [Ruminococcus sp.]